MRKDQSIACWGRNAKGALGNNTSANKSTPVFVVQPSGESTIPFSLYPFVSGVGVGDTHVCAVKSDKTVACWGEGSEGRLGNDSTSDNEFPDVVQNVSGETGDLTEVLQVTSGDEHSCALKKDGSDNKVVCWGNKADGRLGNNQSSGSSSLPVFVQNTSNDDHLTGVIQIEAGGRHTCATLDNGKAVCWGHGGNGRLGDNSMNGNLYPNCCENLDSSTDLTLVKYISAGVLS